MHPATELILARMESNPEEFATDGGRWNTALNSLNQHAPKEERDMMREKLNSIRMDNVHQYIMSELCNPKPHQDRFSYTINTTDTTSVITSLDMKEKALRLLSRYTNNK